MRPYYRHIHTCLPIIVFAWCISLAVGATPAQRPPAVQDTTFSVTGQGSTLIEAHRQAVQSALAQYGSKWLLGVTTLKDDTLTKTTDMLESAMVTLFRVDSVEEKQGIFTVTVSGTLREGKKELVRLPAIENAQLPMDDLLLYEQVQQQRQQAVVALERLLGDPQTYFRRAYHTTFHKVIVTEVGPDYVKGQLQIAVMRNEAFWTTYKELLTNLERIGDDKKILETDQFTFGTNVCTRTTAQGKEQDLMIKMPGILIPVSLQSSLSYPLLIRLDVAAIDRSASVPDYHILFKNVIMSGRPVIDPPRALTQSQSDVSFAQHVCVGLLRRHRAIYRKSHHFYQNTVYPYHFLQQKPASYNANTWIANTLNLRSFGGRDVNGFLGDRFVLNFPVTVNTVQELQALGNAAIVDKLSIKRYRTEAGTQSVSKQGGHDTSRATSHRRLFQ